MIHIKIDNTRAEQLSKAMYKIVSPKDGVTQYLFGWETDSDGVEFASIPSDTCKVYFENLQGYMDEIKTILNGDLSDSEATILGDKIRTGQVILTDLIPSTLERFTPNIIKQNIF